MLINNIIVITCCCVMFRKYKHFAEQKDPSAIIVTVVHVLL